MTESDQDIVNTVREQSEKGYGSSPHRFDDVDRTELRVSDEEREASSDRKHD